MGERKSVLIRLDPKLHDAIRKLADDELRSFNAQVEYMLRRMLIQQGRLSDSKED